MAVGCYDTTSQIKLYDLRNPTEPTTIDSITFDTQMSDKIIEDFDQNYLDKIKK